MLPTLAPPTSEAQTRTTEILVADSRLSDVRPSKTKPIPTRRTIGQTAPPVACTATLRCVGITDSQIFVPSNAITQGQSFLISIPDVGGQRDDERSDH